VDRPRHLDALVTVDFAAGTPNLKPDLDRLLRNQADSGIAIKPFYGRRGDSADAAAPHAPVCRPHRILGRTRGDGQRCRRPHEPPSRPVRGHTRAGARAPRRGPGSRGGAPPSPGGSPLRLRRSARTRHTGRAGRSTRRSRPRAGRPERAANPDGSIGLFLLQIMGSLG